MKSRASIKFCSLHAESHSEFQSIAQCAKMRKVSEDSSSSCGEAESSEEVSNMLQNKVLTKFRGMAITWESAQQVQVPRSTAESEAASMAYTAQ